MYCLLLSGDPNKKNRETGKIKMARTEAVPSPMLAKTTSFAYRNPDDSDALVPWYEVEDIHRYIVGGQHTYKGCRELGENEPLDSPMQKYYLNHNVILVWSKDKYTLIKVSNALNIEVMDKVAKANYRSHLEKMQNKWIKKGRIDKGDD